MGESTNRARAGIRWDSVVDIAWKDTGAGQDEILSIEKFAG